MCLLGVFHNRLYLNFAANLEFQLLPLQVCTRGGGGGGEEMIGVITHVYEM